MITDNELLKVRQRMVFDRAYESAMFHSNIRDRFNVGDFINVITKKGNRYGSDRNCIHMFKVEYICEHGILYARRVIKSGLSSIITTSADWVGNATLELDNEYLNSIILDVEFDPKRIHNERLAEKRRIEAGNGN